MSDSITASFDGKAIIPDVPLALAVGQKLRVNIETIDADSYPLDILDELATDLGVDDLAERHDHYCCEAEKNNEQPYILDVIAAMAADFGVDDLADRHDHYRLQGLPPSAIDADCIPD